MSKFDIDKLRRQYSGLSEHASHLCKLVEKQKKRIAELEAAMQSKLFEETGDENRSSLQQPERR